MQGEPRPLEWRHVWLDPQSGWIDTPVYEGWKLLPGQTIEGPAVIDEQTTTVLVGRGDRLSVDAGGNYMIALTAPDTMTRRDAADIAEASIA